jgi:membrane associated rhomboid family serine protease
LQTSKLILFISIHKKLPIVIVSLIVINSLILYFEYQTEDIYPVFWEYGMIPRYILSGQRLHTLVTHMFIHFDISHLGFNILLLVLFGVLGRVETELGHMRFVLLYVLAGVCGAMLHSLASMFLGFSIFPVSGASGAIFGVGGAGIYLNFPRKGKIIFFLLVLWMIIWAVTVNLYEVFISHWSHLGGYVSGAGVCYFLERKKNRL